MSGTNKQALAFGRNVNRLRTAARMTQETLAEAASIDRSYIQKLEKGGPVVSIEVASRLRIALKCSWDELLKGC